MNRALILSRARGILLPQITTAGIAVLLVCTLLPNSPAHADEAVVVGVNHYPGLDGVDLHGCVNDAKSVATALQSRYNFQVTTLYDDKATKQGILAALDHMKSTIKPDERFAFYFAGHGTQNSESKSVLLPSDAEQGAEIHDLSAEELSAHIRAIPAKSRTVLLDSCFSGGMITSRALHKRTFQMRGYVRPSRRGPNGQSKDLVLVNRSDTNANLGSGPGVCYFTATREDEEAGEDEFNGQRHGVFTYYLVPKLTGKGDVWGDIGDAVRSEVSKYMDDMQHPTISPQFVASIAFENKIGPTAGGEAAASSGPKTLWDLYNSDHVDTSIVSITLDPDKSDIGVGESVSFHATAGRAGYLVVLERGTSGRVNLLFPEHANVDDAKVDANSTTDFPGQNQAFQPDSAGSERIKALLFDSADSAQELLGKITTTAADSAGLSADEMGSRDLVRVSLGRDNYYTSDITFEVTQ